MAYTGVMTFKQFSDQAQSKGNNLLNAIREGKILYDKFYQLTYGKTDEQILALGQFNVAGDTMDQAGLNALRYALGVFNDLAAGSALSPATRDSYLTPFL